MPRMRNALIPILSASSARSGGQSSSFLSGCSEEFLIPGRSGEMIRSFSSRAAASVSSAIVRELGQP